MGVMSTNRMISRTLRTGSPQDSCPRRKVRYLPGLAWGAEMVSDVVVIARYVLAAGIRGIPRQDQGKKRRHVRTVKSSGRITAQTCLRLTGPLSCSRKPPATLFASAALLSADSEQNFRQILQFRRMPWAHPRRLVSTLQMWVFNHAEARFLRSSTSDVVAPAALKRSRNFEN